MPARRLKNQHGPRLVFVTTTARNWNPVFADSQTANIVATILAGCSSHFETCVMGYVIMPSHVHALLGFHEVSKLPTFMQAFKSITSRSIKRNAPSILISEIGGPSGFRVWMRRFDDVIIESQRQFEIKLSYIHNNPVRAGLVEAPEQWPFSSARDWLYEEPGIVPVTKDFSWLEIGWHTRTYANH